MKNDASVIDFPVRAFQQASPPIRQGKRTRGRREEITSEERKGSPVKLLVKYETHEVYFESSNSNAFSTAEEVLGEWTLYEECTVEELSTLWYELTTGHGASGECTPGTGILGVPNEAYTQLAASNLPFDTFTVIASPTVHCNANSQSLAVLENKEQDHVTFLDMEKIRALGTTTFPMSRDPDMWYWMNRTLLYHECLCFPQKGGVLKYDAEVRSDESIKLAAFDYDGTLANTSLFRKGPDAWSLRYPGVTENVLRQLYESGFVIAIMSNQGSIGKATKVKDREIQEKKARTSGFCHRVGVPMILLMATCNPKFADDYRKPNVGMWKFLENYGKYPVDRRRSFYVGDAAGRPKDHADSDCVFAQTLQVDFYTEDEFFLKGSYKKYVVDSS